MTTEGWHSLTAARKIALIGASDRSRFTANLLAFNEEIGFTGTIFLVNPRRDDVLGRPAHRSIAAIPDSPIDCAIISVPNQAVLGALAEAIAAGVKSVVVHSAGFAELGGDGLIAQDQMSQMCQAAGIPLIGPNCTGLVSFPNRVCLTGASVPTDLAPGSIGFVAQSGAVNILALHTGRPLRFSHTVSTGNEAVVTVESVMSCMVADPNTRVIGAFIEQLRDPDLFMSVASRARAAGKPIVVLKSGLSESGRLAAKSHTGALVGSDDHFRTVCQRLRVSTVDDFDELVETLVLFQAIPEPPPGPRTTVVGISGGQASVLADIADAVELPLSRPDPAATEPLLANNPIDLAAGLGAGQNYGDALGPVLNALQSDNAVDQICLAQDLTPGYSDRLVGYIEPFVEAVETDAAERTKPVVLMSTLAGGLHPAIRSRTERGSPLPILQGARASMVALRNLGALAAENRWPPFEPPVPEPSRQRSLLDLASSPSSHARSRGILTSYGIDFPSERLIRSEHDAVEAASEIGYPVVMKAEGDGLAHRSEMGAVRLDLSDERDVRESFRSITAAVRALDVELDGLVVAQQVQGPEIFVALRFDDSFGAVLAVSLGGLYVELFPELVESFVPPATLEEATELTRALRIAPALTNYRGKRGDHLQAIAELFLRLGRLGGDAAGILTTFEMNPLILVDGQGPVAADVKVELAESSILGPSER